MSRKLTAGVLLKRPGTSERVFLPIGSVLPSWAAELVGGHVLDSPPAAEPQPAQAEIEQAQPKPAGPKPPRRSGPGSSAAAWRKYATDSGVQVSDDADRDDVITALDEAGVPTS